MLRLLVREERGGVVAADLHVAHAVRRGAIPVIQDDGAHGLESALVVGADGHDHDHERVFFRRGDADLRARADQERTQVHGAARAVRRNELLVRGDDLLAGLDEALDRHRRHDGADRGALHAAAVLIGTEDHDLAVLLAEGLDALEALLPVVEAARADVHRDVGILDEFELAPLAVLPRAANVAVHVRETEAELRPIYVRSRHFQ